MHRASMARGVAIPQKAAARGGTKEKEFDHSTIVPLPEPAIRCPVGCRPLPMIIHIGTKGKGKWGLQGGENHKGRRGRHT
ncbi:hypothetical protein ES703_104872 [subsurface metagenome]